MINKNDVQCFREDGYFIARRVFDAGELTELRTAAEAVREKVHRQFYPGTRFWGVKPEQRDRMPADQFAQHTWGINELPRKELFDPMLINVWARPNVKQAVEALLTEPRAWGIKLLWNPKAVDYDLKWHRDQMKDDLYDYAMYKPAEQDHIQFNAALNPDHSFVVVPGSHRRPLSELEWQVVNAEGKDDLPGQVVAALEPGDIVFMDAHTLHRGRNRRSDDRLTLHYSAQAQWVPLHPWGHEGHFEWITSDAFINALEPDARPFYQRLRTAERSGESMQFLKDAARAHGWQPQTA